MRFKRTGGLWEGYTILATEFLTGREVASYTEADSIELALERCKIQFPPEEGWDKHWIRNQRTRQEFYKPLDEDVLPLD